MRQRTFFGIFALAEMTQRELERWREVLDISARYGRVAVSPIGTIYARRFVALGLVRTARGGFLQLTEIGESAEI